MCPAAPRPAGSPRSSLPSPSLLASPRLPRRIPRRPRSSVTSRSATTPPPARSSRCRPASRPAACLRSTRNYPSRVAERIGVADFRDVSCSGATTEHVTGPQSVPLGVNPPQLDALASDTDLVTISIGGNDIGFGEIVSECGRRSPLQPTGSACKDHYTAEGTDELAQRIEEAASLVAAALAAIEERSPSARVLLVGYPAILPDEGPGCFPVVPFSPGDVAYLRGVEKALNAMLADEAAGAGVDFVDTYTPSIGHD